MRCTCCCRVVAVVGKIDMINDTSKWERNLILKFPPPSVYTFQIDGIIGAKMLGKEESVDGEERAIASSVSGSDWIILLSQSIRNPFTGVVEDAIFSDWKAKKFIL